MAVPLPAIQVQAQFTPGTWADISPFVMSFDINRPVTRLQGPLWQYQAGTLTALLDNSDGRFDPDNLAGPYTSSTGLQQVVWTNGPGQTKTWVAPRNLSGTTIKVEKWGGASAGVNGGGGAGGEYAAELTYPVIPGNSYTDFNPSGNSAPSATFDVTGVVAHSATPNSSTAGTGSANSIHFDGGPGGAVGTGTPNAVGGGAGSSAGNASAGNAGASGNSGGKGGAAPAGGYAGGDGAKDGRHPGGNGQGPGAAGGGKGTTTVSNRSVTGPNGHSKGGQTRLTYFVTIPAAAVVSQVLPRVPVQVVATWPLPFLTGQGSTFEGGIGNWVTGGNSTVAATALQNHTPSGSGSLLVTAVAAGPANMAAQMCDPANILTQGRSTFPGEVNNGGIWFRTNVTSRACQVGIGFYDATGVSLGSTLGPAVNDTTTGWVQGTWQAVAPANAARALVYGQVNSALATERHFFDDVTLSGPVYPLFTGTADSWTETPVDYSAGYSEVTLTATDGFKLLAGNTIPATSLQGAGEDTGARVDRILDWAAWDPAARQIDTGDTTLAGGTTLGSDALSLLQLTADTEVGEVYVNGAGNVVFRHRQGILIDDRSTSPQAIFGDNPGNLTADVQWHGDGVHGGSPFFIQVSAANSAGYFTASTPVSKQLWIWSSVPYASGVQMLFAFYDSTVTLISTVTGTVTATTTTPQLLSLSGTSPALTAFMNIPVQVQGIPAANVTFFIAAAPPLDGNDLVLGLTPWSAGLNTTMTTLANWVPTAGVPGELPYAAVGRANDDTTLANDIQITSADPSFTGTLQEATDPVSVYVYQSERSYARTDLLLPDDATAFQYASYVLGLSDGGEDRFDTLAVDPLADTGNLYPQVLGREIGDRIQVWRRPAPGTGYSLSYGGIYPGNAVVKDVFIRGIQHTHDAGAQTWLTTWTLQSAAKYGSVLILDDPIKGQLDVNNLAY